MGQGSQALAQAEIDKQKAANKDITNWKDNITGGGTDQGSITASGTKKATRKVEKMADNKHSFFNSFNNPKDISMGFSPSWDVDGPEFKAYVKNKGQKLGYRDKQVNLSSNWNNSSVSTTPPPANTPSPATTPGPNTTTTPAPNSGASSQSGVTINNNVSGYTGNNPATSTTPGPTNPGGGMAKNIDAMLGRQPKGNTFKKTTGLTNQPGGKTPYKFRGLENQFQSWQMQHYNNDTTT